MEIQSETELMRAYMQSLTSSRVSMNNMLNVFVQQERNMQSIIVLTHQNRHQLVQRDARDSGIDFSSGMSQFAHNLPRNRRGGMSARGGEWTRSFTNNNNRNRTEDTYRPNARHYVQRHTRTPFPAAGQSFSMPINFPVNQQINLPIPPPMLNGFLNNLNLDPDTLAPVIVRPTEAVIDNSTEEVLFGIVSNPMNSVCPITRERFGANDRVMQIVHCGHNFNPPSLRHWFQSNVRCPLCRYDIRDYDPRNAINNPYRTLASRTTREDIPDQGMGDHLADEVLNSLQQPDSGGLEGDTSTTPHSERTLQVNVANRANVVSRIASHISRDIMAQLDNIPIDGSGNIMLEYSFRHPTTPPTDSQETTSNLTMQDLSGNVQ